MPNRLLFEKVIYRIVCRETLLSHKYAQSQGSFNVYGNINYGNIWKRMYFDLINFFKSQKKLNPFFDKSSYLYKGVLYILERNDFNPNKENWEKYLIKTYSLTHFRNSYRFHLKQINKGGKVDKQTQLPEELFLVNNDIVQDNMYDVKLPF